MPAQEPSPASWYAEISPEPDSKLEQLAAMYDEAKTDFDKAEERYEQIKAALKEELTKAAPGKTTIRLSSTYLDRPLQMTAKPGQRRVDGQRLKAEQPEIYNAYVTQGKPYWDLRVAK